MNIYYNYFITICIYVYIYTYIHFYIIYITDFICSASGNTDPVLPKAAGHLIMKYYYGNRRKPSIYICIWNTVYVIRNTAYSIRYTEYGIRNTFYTK